MHSNPRTGPGPPTARRGRTPAGCPHRRPGESLLDRLGVGAPNARSQGPGRARPGERRRADRVPGRGAPATSGRRSCPPSCVGSARAGPRGRRRVPGFIRRRRAPGTEAKAQVQTCPMAAEIPLYPLEPGLRQTHRENSAKTLGALLDQVSELGFGIAPARMTAPGPLTPRPRATHLTAVSPDDPNRSTPATSNLAGNIPYCTRFCELRFSSTCRSSPPPFLRVVLGLSACAARSAMRR